MDQPVNIDISKKNEPLKDYMPKITILQANVQPDANASSASGQAIDFCCYDEQTNYYNNSFNESETVFYDPFELYQQMRSELYGEEISDSMEDEFAKLLSGEQKTQDVLANAIIEATQIDEYENILSEDELSVFFSELYDNKIKGLEIDELLDYDSNVEDLYQAQNDEITLKYLNKSAQDCTPEELNQVYAISLAESILNSSVVELEDQDNSDGAISDIFNWFKEETGVETCREDVLAALDKQKAIVVRLTDAIKKGNFEEVWNDVTGVEYDPEKIALYQDKITQLNFISENLAAVDSFYESLSNNENQYNVENTYNSFIKFYGEEKGEQKFLEALKYGYNNNIDSGIYDPNNLVESIQFDKDKNLVFTMQNGDTFELGKLKDVNASNLTSVYSDKFKKIETQEHLGNLEKLLGVDYDSLAKECMTLSSEALGEANAVNNVLNEYINSQEKFIDEMACFTQFAGMGSMLIGGTIACVVPGAQGLGLGMIKVGQAMSVMGTFGDEALEVVDKITNDRTYEEDLAEYKEILKEFVTDGALFASGYVIGTYSNALGDMVFTETGSKFLSKFADIGFDATMSLLSDMAITGEIDLFGEGLSQFLGIVTGSAFARVNAANAKMMDGATDVLNKQGLDSAIDYLETQGASKKTIQEFKVSSEAQRFDVEIQNGKLTPQDAVLKLEEMGASKKQLRAFKKAHGLEYRTPAEIARDLRSKYKIDSSLATEAAIRHELNAEDSLQYCNYRKAGESYEVAKRHVEYDKLTVDEKVKNLADLGISNECLNMYAKDLNFAEYDSIVTYLNADEQGKIEYLKAVFGMSQGEADNFVGDFMASDDYVNFRKLLSQGATQAEARKFAPQTEAEIARFKKAAEFSNMDIDSRIRELETLGLTRNEASEFAQNCTQLDYLKINTLLDLGLKASDAARYGKKVGGVLLWNLPSVLKDNRVVLDKLIDAGATGQLLDSLASDRAFGRLLGKVKSPELENRIERLKNVTQDPKAVQGLQEAITNQYSLSSAIAKKYPKYFDDFNYIIFGPPVDKVLTDRLSSIEQKYGLKIVTENSTGYSNKDNPNYVRNKEASSFIDESYLKALESALEKIKEKRLPMPKEVYFTNFQNTLAAGCCIYMNSSAINMDISKTYDPTFFEASIIHETAHGRDCINEATGECRSSTKAFNARIVKNPAQKLENIEYKGKTITAEEISGIIRDYATTNIREFKCEVEALLVYKAIIEDKKGGYTIDTNRIPSGYCTGWTGSAKDHQSLAKIMELYNYLIS